MYAKDANKAKYKLLINKCEGIGLNYSKAFIEYANDIDCIYGNIEEKILNKKRKILNIFHDMIAGMLSSKNLNK